MKLKKALFLFCSKREKKVKTLVKQNKKPQQLKEIKRRQLTKKKKNSYEGKDLWKTNIPMSRGRKVPQEKEKKKNALTSRGLESLPFLFLLPVADFLDLC